MLRKGCYFFLQLFLSPALEKFTLEFVKRFFHISNGVSPNPLVLRK